MHDQKTFQHPLRIFPEDIDEMGHVNNTVYIRWTQEVAAAHWKNVANNAWQNKYAWVVLRHEIDYHHPAFLLDQLFGVTWVGAHHGARFDRYVEVRRGPTTLATTKTTWCLLDAPRLRPMRIPTEIIDLF